MYEARKDSFTLNEKKAWLIPAMHNQANPRHECCPFLGECIEEVHSCNLPEHASRCFYRTLKISIKAVEKEPVKIVETNKNIIQKCKRK
jgi:hypothetical protein